jgi:DNA-binding transcriptional MerR regulator
MQRAGNRRYYRPADVELARRIHRLLNEQGYTIRGVQQLLAARGGSGEEASVAAAAASAPTPITMKDLKALRRTLAEALEEAKL